jgi:hypothetical protein
MQIDPRRLDRAMTCLGLDGFECHPGFAKTCETRVAKLVTACMCQAGTVSRTFHDLVDAVFRKWLATPWALQDDEDPVGREIRWAFVAQVVTDGAEERVRRWHHPLMTALSLGDEEGAICDSDVRKSETEHLTSPESGEQHREHHRSVSVGPQRPEEGGHLLGTEDPRQRPGNPDEWNGSRPPAPSSGRQPRGTGFVRTGVSPRAIKYA